MKWLKFDNYEWRNLFREVLLQCDDEDEVYIIQLKLERILEDMIEERLEEIEGGEY